jgi:hypothetical protein
MTAATISERWKTTTTIEYLLAAVAVLAIGSSPAALAYEQPPPHRQRTQIVLPADPEPPLRPGDITVADPDITDIPLPDPDPATTALKQTPAIAMPSNRACTAII